MPSKQSEAVRRHWTAARLAMEQPDAEVRPTSPGATCDRTTSPGAT
jgi:hypothetical protein